MDYERRAFFRLDRLRSSDAMKVGSNPIRPPWSFDEDRFVELCSTCGECVEACPQSLLEPDKDGYPTVNFVNECTFCSACVDACNDGALKITADVPPWDHLAEASEQCLATQGIACQSCQDACETQAISFTTRIGSPSIPNIASESCTGCGACISICPVGAIQMNSSDVINSLTNTT